MCGLSQHLRAAVSDIAVLGQPSQTVSQGWPTGAGLTDVLVRALQLTAAAHPSLWFSSLDVFGAAGGRTEQAAVDFPFSSIMTD